MYGIRQTYIFWLLQMTIPGLRTKLYLHNWLKILPSLWVCIDLTSIDNNSGLNWHWCVFSEKLKLPLPSYISLGTLVNSVIQKILNKYASSPWKNMYINYICLPGTQTHGSSWWLRLASPTSLLNSQCYPFQGYFLLHRSIF